ncbi:MAG: nicotinate-nucleotide adenylyltransferase [Gemmatimonadetes bacterium]|nr:nicotinate-nucleotide adenylyltransferase [Gemmatimonadota bacterium]
MDGGPRVGVFGGTFDPPHRGHAVVAAEVADVVGLDRVLWVPASTPPHKTGWPVTSAEVRSRMVSATIRNDPRFELCELELERGGVSYTVDTLRALKAAHPDWSLMLVIGDDLLAGFSRWREPDAILELAEVVAISRAGAAKGGLSDEVDFPVRIVSVTPVDVSSTRIRERVRLGKSVRAMVVTRVMSIIESERLYQAHRPRSGGEPRKPEEAETFVPGGIRTAE